jgi:hypothetical protein
MFIDDELDLDEKCRFVEQVHGDQAFMIESLDLLGQEKLLRSDVVLRVPAVEIRPKASLIFDFLKPLGIFAGGLATALVLFFLFQAPQGPLPVSASVPYRFVIYQPGAEQAAIAGSFTQWQAVPMRKNGVSGYWDLTLDLPEGEHRFVYILDGQNRVADPTILTRERDDFGGENSILNVEV